MKLSNKTILITGGGSGIGLGLCRQLVGKGNKVIICGRDRDKLAQVKAELPSVHTYRCDLTDTQAIDELFGQLKQDSHRLDVLFNNAGVVESWNIMKKHIPSELIAQKISTNFTGPVLMIQHFLQQADSKRDNLIVNITTEVALLPVPLLPLYSASKSGLHSFTLSLRIQLRGTTTRVVEIMPPAVETKMTTQDLTNTSKMQKPDAFAAQIIKAIEAGKTEFSPGMDAFLIRLFSRILPTNTSLRVIHYLSQQQLAGL